MPVDPPPSAGSLAPSPDDPDRASEPPARRFRWKRNLALFLATVVSVFHAGTFWASAAAEGQQPAVGLKHLASGWPFAVPLLAILLVHEFGHYIAARAHRVEASLPFFIPLPILQSFGTMGAVISMKGRIKSRNALLDIGASGPLAGLFVALPVLVVGLMRSEVKAVDGPALQEGRSLLYMLVKRIVLGPIPATHDVYLGPIAMAGWVGLCITMFNLLPVGQLDGGHIAYALFGDRQNRFGRVVHMSLLAVYGANVAYFLPSALRAGSEDAIVAAVSNGLPWLTWFGVLFVMFRLGGRGHPPTEPGELSPRRKIIAVASLLLFVLIFMPTPFGTY